MIFPKLFCDSVVQVNDQLRFDARSSYFSPDETQYIVRYEIQLGALSGFIDISELKYIDWQFPLSGTTEITLRITTENELAITNSVDLVVNITVIEPSEEILFADDSDLLKFEQDIMRYLAEGRSSFIYIHRTVTRLIVDTLDQMRIWDASGARLTPQALVDQMQIKQWAIYHALYLIFFNNNNANADIFVEKAKEYKKLSDASKPNSLRLNVSGGETEDQRRDIRTTRLVRR